MALRLTLSFFILTLSCYVQCVYCYRIFTQFYMILGKRQNLETCNQLFATQKIAFGVRVSNQTGQCNAIFFLPDYNQTFTDDNTYAIKMSEEESFKPQVPFDEFEDKVWVFPDGLKNGTVIELFVTMPIVQGEDGVDLNVFGVYCLSHPFLDIILNLTEQYLIYVNEKGLNIFTAIFKDNGYSFSSLASGVNDPVWDMRSYTHQFIGKESWKLTFLFQNQSINVLIDDSFFNQYGLSTSTYKWLYVFGYPTMKNRAFIHSIKITTALG